MPDAARNPISADAAERRGGHGASRLAARLRRRRSAPRCSAGRSTSRSASSPGAGRPRTSSARLVEAHRAMADRAPRADAGGRAAEPVRVLRADHQRRRRRRTWRGWGGRTSAISTTPSTPTSRSATRSGSIGETIGAIRHIHISENHRGAPGTRAHRPRGGDPGGAGDAGYDGWFTVEAFGQALPDLAAATRVWRPLFDERGRGGDGRRAGDPRRLGELTRGGETMSDDETRPHPARAWSAAARTPSSARCTASRRASTTSTSWSPGRSRSTPEKARASGAALGLAADRTYDDFATMAKREARRKNGIEAVAIVTPNHMHAPAAREFLKRGIHVICDKPLTATLAEAKRLQKAAAESGALFILTHNYTGYPMIRQARAMVADGQARQDPRGAGRVRPGLAGDAGRGRPGSKQAGWRTDPAQSGAGGVDRRHRHPRLQPRRASSPA